MIEGLPTKPTGQKYSHREIAKTCKTKLNLQVSDKSISKWRKLRILLAFNQLVLMITVCGVRQSWAKKMNLKPSVKIKGLDFVDFFF